MELKVSSQKMLDVSLFSSGKRHFLVKLRLCHHFVVRFQVPVEEHDSNMSRVRGYYFTQAVAYRLKVDGHNGGLDKRTKTSSL